LAAARAALIQL